MSGPTASDPLPVTESTASAVPEVPAGMVSAPNASAGSVENAYGAGDVVADGAPHDLKRKTARGALVSMFGQVATFVLRIGSMVVLARLLDPDDFGVVGMVTACTGFLGLFRDAGSRGHHSTGIGFPRPDLDPLLDQRFGGGDFICSLRGHGSDSHSFL
jgi:hypothetical protein